MPRFQMDIFDYWMKQKRHLKENRQKLTSYAKLFEGVVTSVVSKYVGMPMTHEIFNQMKQDLMANGISEETSQYIASSRSTVRK